MPLLPYTTGYLAGAVVSAAVAALVLWARPGRRQNRLLALILFWETLTHVVAAWRVQFRFWGLLPEALAFATLFRIGIAVSPFLYLLFLATIDTPLTRPLRTRGASTALVALLVLAVGGVLAVTEMAPTSELVGPGATDAVGSLVETVAFGTWLVVALYGLAVAVQYHRRTDAGTLRRRQARAYVAAFGSRDLVSVVFHASVVVSRTAWTETGGSPGEILFVERQWLPLIWGFLFAVFIAYGLLSTQLFGVDLTLKLGVERSTFVGAFGVAFLVVSELVEALLGVDGTLYGVAAAVAIGLFFRRVEEGAKYVADRLMPGVEDTEAYRRRRKEEIYRIQLEELMADDQVTAKERRALLRLQESLGLDGEAANRIERDVLGDTTQAGA